MPYIMYNANLPPYVDKLGAVLKAKWIAVFNYAHKQSNDEKKAFVVANNWLKKQLVSREVVAKTVNQQTVKSIVFVPTGKELIKKTKDGDEYVEFVLADNLPDKEGDAYAPELLQQWEKEINDGEMIVGDTDHEEYDKIVSMGLPAEETASLIKKAKKGIAKTIKAIYKNGKLFVRAIFDKRYRAIINKATGVSLEAMVDKDYNSKGLINKGSLLGFTFAVNQQSVNPRAQII